MLVGPSRPKAPARYLPFASFLALFAQSAIPPWAGCAPFERDTPSPTAAPAPVHTPGHATERSAPTDEVVRIKGREPRLTAHRKRNSRIQRLTDGDPAREGDVIQISYVSAGTRHGVIVSLDDRGVVTLHYPNDPNAPCGLIARGEQPLAQAYELDDAAGFERFVFVTSPSTTLNPVTVLEAARQLARGPNAEHQPLRLPKGWRQSSFTLTKQALRSSPLAAATDAQ